VTVAVPSFPTTIPGRQVGQRGRLRQRQPRRQSRREGGDHRVTGAGHVEDLACPRRQVHRGLPRPDQAHPVLATGDQQRLDPAIFDQGLGAADQVLGIGAAADHGLEFGEVGGDQGRPAVDREIPALGIHQHRDTGLAGGLDQHMWSAQGALAVIREDHRRRTRKLRAVQGQQVARLQARKSVLEVEPDQLLVAADDPQLGNGGRPDLTMKPATDAGVLEQMRQLLAGVIGAGHPDQARSRAQGREIERDVARTTRTLLDLAHMDHGHRSLGGDAIRRAMPIAVEHQVPGNQYPDLFEIGKADLHLWRAERWKDRPSIQDPEGRRGRRRSVHCRRPPQVSW
jgi:hypothetical protein